MTSKYKAFVLCSDHQKFIMPGINQLFYVISISGYVCVWDTS